MTYSNARIVRGNDFKLRVILKAPGIQNEEPTWEDFDINSCSDVHVALICEKDQIVIPLEWEVEAGSTNILICPVKGNYLHSGAAYGVEVKGIDAEGNAWRWKAKGREMFSIVDNTSAQNVDTVAEPEWEINAFVGLLAEVGPKGETGDKGATGDKGPTGERGPLEQADWNQTETSEPSYIKNKPDLSNYYTKTQADDKFLARYRKIQLSTEALSEGDDVETWHGVGQYWEPVEVYVGSGADDKWNMTGYEFPEAYDSANDNYYVKINNVHVGDEIQFRDIILKETPSSTPHILIIDNSGTTIWSDVVQINSQENPTTSWMNYTFESDYDYIIIGTDCDKPAYVQRINYDTSVTDNSDLSGVIPTISQVNGALSQVNGALNHKADSWDIVQSDWTQTDTDAKDYIKNKPTIPVLPNNIVTANQTLSIAVVSSMPASPDQNTIYVIL